MRWLITLPIAVYWLLWPSRWRRRCLFHESCSRHVFRVTNDEGFIPGLVALRRRVRQCRNGYHVVLSRTGPAFMLADGSHLAEAQIDPLAWGIERLPRIDATSPVNPMRERTHD